MAYNLRTGMIGNSNLSVDVHLDDLDASNITSGTFAVARIPTLAKSKISTASTWAEGDIPLLDATKIATGTLHADRIPSLDTSKINTGILHTDRIPDMNADKITTGTFATARIPALPYLTTETLTMVAFKNVVSASSDFADFQSRVNAL